MFMANTTIKTNWQPCLLAGQRTEKKIKEYFLKTLRFSSIDIMEGNFPDYDLRCFKERNGDVEITTFEVKQDFKGDHTNNLAFEFECKGKPSGLAVTKADYWIHCRRDTVYIFCTSVLKEYLKANWKYFRVVYGGDDMASKMVLVHKNMISAMINFEAIEANKFDWFSENNDVDNIHNSARVSV